MVHAQIANCLMPNCKNKRAAIQRRGPNSPVLSSGGDKSRRYKWCRYHQRGAGRAERRAYEQEKINEN